MIWFSDGVEPVLVMTGLQFEKWLQLGWHGVIFSFFKIDGVQRITVIERVSKFNRKSLMSSTGLHQ